MYGLAIIPERSPRPEASASKEPDKRDSYHDGDDDCCYEREKEEDPEQRVDHGLLLSTGRSYVRLGIGAAAGPWPVSVRGGGRLLSVWDRWARLPSSVNVRPDRENDLPDRAERA